MATHHTIFDWPAQVGRAAAISSAAIRMREDTYALGEKSLRPE